MTEYIPMSTAHTTTHAEARIAERLTEAGWSTEDQDKLAFATKALASRTNSDSEAIRVAVLPQAAGDRNTGSNGNEVWAIYRSQRLVTVMLRRSTQPDSNLRVNTVNRLV